MIRHVVKTADAPDGFVCELQQTRITMAPEPESSWLMRLPTGRMIRVPGPLRDGPGRRQYFPPDGRDVARSPGV